MTEKVPFETHYTPNGRPRASEAALPRDCFIRLCNDHKARKEADRDSFENGPLELLYQDLGTKPVVHIADQSSPRSLRFLEVVFWTLIVAGLFAAYSMIPR